MRAPLVEAPRTGHAGGRPGRPVAGVDGAWACAICDNINFAMRDACNKCQTPKAECEAPVEAQTTAHTAHGFQKGAPVAGADGNWVCGLCKNVNYSMRDACNRCQTPKEDAEQANENPYLSQVHAEPVQKTGGKPVAGVDGNWSCPACQNVNFAARSVCNRCAAPKPQPRGGGWGKGNGSSKGGGSGKGGPVAGVDGNWACPACGNVNYAVREACNRCQTAKPVAPRGGGCGKGGPVAGVDGNWACSLCGNVNFAMRDACNKCQAPKEEAAVERTPRHPRTGHAGGRP